MLDFIILSILIIIRMGLNEIVFVLLFRRHRREKASGCLMAHLPPQPYLMERLMKKMC